MKNYNHIISLGKDCMSRTIPTRYGIKKTKNQGELTLPFDLAIHRYDAVCDIIKNHFDGYADPNNLELKNGIIQHKKYFVRYTHEKDQIFSENNFELLIKKYKRRVENFKSYILDDNILFISNFPLYPLELYETIKKTYPNLNFKILNFDVRPFDGIELYRSDAFDNKNKDIIYIRSPIPNPNYIWWKEENYKSKDGNDFEKYIAYSIERVFENGL